MGSVDFVSFWPFWVVLGYLHAVTFQASHVGKDKLYSVGRGEYVSLAREGRKVKVIFICFGGSGGFVPVFLVLVHAATCT